MAGRTLRERSVASSLCEEGRKAQACSIRSTQRRSSHDAPRSSVGLVPTKLAHPPAGGAMLRHLGPGTANALLVQGRRVAPFHKVVAKRPRQALMSLRPEDAAAPAVGQMGDTAGA
eukprot:609680-Hanusia_phi.AAC.1